MSIISRRAYSREAEKEKQEKLKRERGLIISLFNEAFCLSNGKRLNDKINYLIEIEENYDYIESPKLTYIANENIDYIKSLYLLDQILQINPIHKHALLLYKIVEAKILENIISLNNDVCLNKIKSRYNCGIIKFYSKEYKEAIEYFTLDINDNPKPRRAIPKGNYDDYYDSGYTDYYEGNYEEYAIIDQRYALPYYKRGITYFFMNNYQEAASDIKYAIHIFNDYTLACYKLGLLKGFLNQHSHGSHGSGSIGLLTSAIYNEPNYIKAYYHRGRFNYNIKKYESAINDFTYSIGLDSKFAESFYYRGLAKYELKRYSDAIDDFMCSTGLDKESVHSYYLMGLARGFLKDFDGALKNIYEAIKIDPNCNIMNNINVSRNQSFIDYDAFFVDIQPDYIDRDAIVYCFLKNYEKSLDIYRELFTDNSENAILNNNMGFVYYRLNQYDNAIEYCNKAIAINPLYSKAYNNRGYIRFCLKEYRESIDDFTKAIEIDSEFLLAYYYRGKAEFELGHYLNTVKDFSKVINLDNNFLPAYIDCGNTKLVLNEFKEAIDVFSKAVELNLKYAKTYYLRGVAKTKLGYREEALIDISNAIAIDSTNPDAYYERGKIRRDMEDYDDAINDFNNVIKLNPDYINAYLDRGRIRFYHWIDLPDDANDDFFLNDFSIIIELDPNNAEAFYERGYIHKFFNDYQQALKDLTKSVELDPYNIKAYLEKGITNTLLNDYAAAICDYTILLKIDPKNIDAYYERASVKEIQRDYNGAIEDYTAIISLIPQSPQCHNAYKKRANLRINNKDYIGALDDYSKALECGGTINNYYYNKNGVSQREQLNAIGIYSILIELEPNNACAFYNRGIIKEQIGNVNGALDDLNKAISLDSNFIFMFVDRARINIKLKYYDKAIQDYTHIIKINFESETAYIGRGYAQGIEYNYQEALCDFKEAQTLNPQNTYVNKKIELLEDAVNRHSLLSPTIFFDQELEELNK